MLLLTPSRGHGGGIERVADMIEDAWAGPVARVDVMSARGSRPSVRDKASFAARALSAALRERPTVVVAVHVALAPVAVIAALGPQARVGVIGHGREVWGPMSAARRMLLNRCTLVAVSPFTARWLARRAGIDANGVQVVLSPVAEHFAKVAGTPPTPSHNRELALLTVSRITQECRYKDHGSVARAVALLAQRGRPARWTVIGDGDDLPALAALCEQLGVGDSVDLLGHVDDVRLQEAYAAADVLVLPSVADPAADPPIGEGFGLVYAEAGAYGVPSIACTEGGGSSAFVVHGETGLLVEPRSPAALLQAIERLQDENGLIERLGRGAQARVRAAHMPERFGPALRHALGL